MAERRMFAKTIIDSDAFLDMPMSARLLYYDLGMRADDDGFINSPRRIMRTIGGSDDDLKILTAKKFVIPFETGVCVIKHWKTNNQIRSDRYTETKYKQEKSMLELDENSSYRYTNGIPDDTKVVDKRVPQYSIGKDSVVKDSVVKDSQVDVDTIKYFNSENLNDIFLDFLKMRKDKKIQNTERAVKILLNKLEEIADTDEKKIRTIEKSIVGNWSSFYPEKNTDKKDEPKQEEQNPHGLVGKQYWDDKLNRKMHPDWYWDAVSEYYVEKAYDGHRKQNCPA